MPLPKTITFVTFDCYGTLIDWEEGIFKAVKAEAAKDDVEIIKADFMPIFFELQAEFEDGSYELYAEVLRRTVVAAAKKVGWKLEPSRAGFLPASIGGWKPFPDVNEALNKIAKKYSIGLLSNIDDKLLGGTRRHLEADFDLVVTAQQVRTYKPEVAHFKECARRFGGKKGWVHISADYRSDVEPCLKQRIPVIWVNRKKEKLDPKKKKTEFEVSTFKAAAAKLKVR